MRVQYASDLHLEFDHDNIFRISNITGAQVLVLAGDIFVAQDILRDPISTKYYTKELIDDFLTHCASEFDHVILIMGNHEHYMGRFTESARLIRENLANLGLKNIHFLDKQYIIIDGVVFWGATMWTDMGNDPLAIALAGKTMNDYKVIKRDASSYTKLRAEDTLFDHNRAKNALIETLGMFPDLDFVVVTHHAPSPLSVHPRYSGDNMTNKYYNSNFSGLMFDNPNIKFWIHGHTHDRFDYMIGLTRVLCNPRGYVGHELAQGFDDTAYFDL